MNDFYAVMKIQQGRLKRAMREMGFNSAAELARAAGVSYANINNLLNFKVSTHYSPKINNTSKRGQWRDSIIRICQVLGYEPSELFPEHLDRVITTNCIESFSDMHQLSGASETRQLTPYEESEQSEVVTVVSDALGKLPEREREAVVECVMNGVPYEVLGRKWKVSRSRVAQIKERGLRSLRDQVYEGEPLAEMADA